MSLNSLQQLMIEFAKAKKMPYEDLIPSKASCDLVYPHLPALDNDFRNFFVYANQEKENFRILYTNLPHFLSIYVGYQDKDLIKEEAAVSSSKWHARISLENQNIRIILRDGELEMILNTLPNRKDDYVIHDCPVYKEKLKSEEKHFIYTGNLLCALFNPEELPTVSQPKLSSPRTSLLKD